MADADVHRHNQLGVLPSPGCHSSTTVATGARAKRGESAMTAQSEQDADRVKKILSLVKVLLIAKKVKEDSEPAEVLPGVFLGSIGAAHNKEGLRRRGITHVLTVAAGFAPKHPNDFTYCLVDVADHPDESLNRHFERCLKFIAQAQLDGGRVLVHCFAGKSRSSTICAAYAMATEGTTLRETMARIRSARPIARPNELIDFEQELVQARRQGRLLGRVQINAAAAHAARETTKRAEAELKDKS